MKLAKSKKQPSKTRRSIRISEKQRTVILVVLIIFATAFIYWIQSGIDENFVETL